MAEIDGIDIRIVHRRFFEDAVVDGDVDYHIETSEDHESLTLGEAIDLLRSEGVTFAATGNDWASDPNGSQIIDYVTGEREETEGFIANTDHLPGYVVEAIMAGVDSNQNLSPYNLRQLEHRERSYNDPR